MGGPESQGDLTLESGAYRGSDGDSIPTDYSCEVEAEQHQSAGSRNATHQTLSTALVESARYFDFELLFTETPATKVKATKPSPWVIGLVRCT